MKIAFDSRDFTISALSLSAGMLLVAGLAAWHSGGDLSILSLTLGLPGGVLTFWAMYTTRMRAARGDAHAAHDDLSLHGLDEHGDYHPNQGSIKHPSYSSLTLEALRINQRMRSLQGRQAPLLNEEQDRPHLDQWHQ